MQDILRDIKRHTSKIIIKAIEGNLQESRRDWLLWFFEREGRRNPSNEHYQFWQAGSHPIKLFGDKMIDQKLDYLHDNPVVAGWVDKPEHFLYSSARDYTSDKGLIDDLSWKLKSW